MRYIIELTDKTTGKIQYCQYDKQNKEHTPIITDDVDFSGCYCTDKEYIEMLCERIEYFYPNKYILSTCEMDDEYEEGYSICTYYPELIELAKQTNFPNLATLCNTITLMQKAFDKGYDKGRDYYYG